MEKLGFDLDDGSSPADAKQTNPQVTFRFRIILLLQLKWTCNAHILFSRFRDIGSSKTFDTEMHPIVGACLPMQRRQLPSTKLSEDEESCDAHEKL